MRRLTLVDPDLFDRTNAPRQLMFPEDIGQPKAVALARNILPHMTNPGAITAVCEDFGAHAGAESIVNTCDALVVGVDNNRARLAACRLAIHHQIPAVFVLLSEDGRRSQVFLQRPVEACLGCVLPNLDEEAQMPCAAASAASCYLAAAHALALVAAAVMQDRSLPTWRETSLDGSTERALSPLRRSSCVICQPHRSIRIAADGRPT